LFALGESYVPNKTILERIVGITSSCGNIYEVVDDNSNHYIRIMMEAMRVNHGYSGEDLSVDEKPNMDAQIIVNY
jgi:hypothetical protein